jgi:hypothetical protein
VLTSPLWIGVQSYAWTFARENLFVVITDLVGPRGFEVVFDGGPKLVLSVILEKL